ncbi:hypothetical protein Sgleb_43880 [Streptomyces glebosus]|uniref:Uncharacterized protein n=1 Tax=Streptomyces glebosus TaxID=249580 RepID=A0A640T1G8_9ACTN|nr:hypothetical protein [Streptomyces glebosus]GFE16341.1 hypothetical protein Sgleb_43880 [Streptomyces glebosus]GHG64305.1 hypothetical protein GCM10010513_32240 [Streptomyces glebosus]
MSNAPVDPAEVPVFTGDLDLLESKVKALSHGGSQVKTIGSDVHKSFGGLAAFYKAPEAEQLFGVTRPVEDKARDLGQDMHAIARALGTYAREITPLVEQLKQLKQDAADFRAKEAADDDWREDGDLVDENLNRRNKIAEVWAAFQEAERDCHAKIVGLVGGKALHAIDGSHPTGYGYDAEALKASKSLPWGDAVEESVPWWHVWEHAYDFGKGVVVDGVWGTIKGLGTLIGVDGWDAAGQAWTGLAKLTTGVLITTLPIVGPGFLMIPGDKLPGWLRDSRTAMKETGKALVAWDQWESNGSRAAGAVTFNVITAIFTRGGGAAVSGTGKAATAAKAVSIAGKVGHAIDPMTYVFKGAGAGISKIGDVMAHLKDLGHVEAPKISEGAYSLPEGALKMPDGTVQLPKGAAVPDGAIKLPDGSIKLPEGTVTLPPNTVKDPFNGRYMDGAGSLYKEDGSLLQRAEDAPRDNPASPAAGAVNPRVEVPVLQDQPVLTGVGGRGDDVTRVGSDISDAGRAGDKAGTHPVGDDLIGGRTGNGPPEGAANHLPGGRADDPAIGPSASHELPGGHGDRPGTVDQHGPTGGHEEGSPSGGHAVPASGSEGATGTAGDGPGGRTTAGPGSPLGDAPGDANAWERPRDDSGPFERGGEQEQQIRDQLRGSKVKPNDLERVLTNLAEDPAGREVADTIASGRFKGVENFDQVVSSLSHADKMSGGIEQLRLANRMHEMGVRDISFEIKGDIEIKPGVRTGEKTDLDVMARDADGNVHGYQFKEIQNPKKLVKKVFDNIKQLDESGADFKTFVVDTKGTLADHQALRSQDRLAEVYGNTSIQFIIRVEDGVLIIPPNGKFMPEGTL